MIDESAFETESLGNNISVCISKDHRFGCDAFLLADFAQHRLNDRACDLGTGCGIIPLLWCRKNPPISVLAVDIQNEAAELTKRGAELSHVDDRITPICADLSSDWYLPYRASLSLVTCNPPYKAEHTGLLSSGSAQKIARHELSCTVSDVCRVSASLLKFGGRLCICNRPERLADCICAMRENGIEPKKLRFVAKNHNSEPWLFLLEGKLGSKPFMRVLPTLTTVGEDGEISTELAAAYRVEGAPAVRRPQGEL